MASPNYINKGLLTDIENTRDKIGRLKNQLLTRSTSETTESLAKILETYINMLNDLGYTYDSLSQGGKPYTRKYAHANPLTANNSSYDESVSSVDDNTVMNDVPWNTIFDAIKNAKENFWNHFFEYFVVGVNLLPFQLELISKYINVPNFGNNITSYDKLSSRDQIMHRKYVELYEATHNEEGGEADTLRRLFANCPEEYRNDINEIKYLLYNSKGKCHDLFFEYAKEMEPIVDYNAQGNYYRPADRQMHLDIEQMRTHQYGYGVFVHEAGHNIDHIMGKKLLDIQKAGDSSLPVKGQYANSLSISNIYRDTENTNSINSPLHDVMYKEVENRVDLLLGDYSENGGNLNSGQWDYVKKVIMGKENDSNMSKSDSNAAYIKCLEDINGYLKDTETGKYTNSEVKGIIEYYGNKDNSLVKEVYNGITNGSVIPKDTHEGFVGTHDPDSYNYYTSDYTSYERSTGAVETEFFAEYFRVNMTGSKKEEAYTKMYLNDSWNEVEKLIKKADEAIDNSDVIVIEY